MLTITGSDELKAKVGEELGVSDWHEVTQEEIDAFADATGDHQWIHVDPERALEPSPKPSLQRSATRKPRLVTPA